MSPRPIHEDEDGCQCGTGASAWCAQYDLHSRGESPPWTEMTGTIRLSKGVRREAGSEESRRRNRGLDVQKPDMRPLQCWVTQPGMGKPDCHSERCGVDPAGLREEGRSYLRRSPALSAGTASQVTARDRTGAVSRGHSSRVRSSDPAKDRICRCREQTVNCSMNEWADNYEGRLPPSNHGVLAGRNPVVTATVAVPQLRCKPEPGLGALLRFTIGRNRRIHPSTYGGVGGRGCEAPPARFHVFKNGQAKGPVPHCFGDTPKVALWYCALYASSTEWNMLSAHEIIPFLTA
jgi:hypothetical protein